MQANHEIAWRIEQALHALRTWAEPGDADTHRATSGVQAVLLPTLHRPGLGSRLAGILQEIIYVAAQAELRGGTVRDRARLTELLYLAQDTLFDRRLLSA